MRRKCIYTGKESLCRDKPMPNNLAGDEIHNWANAVPCSLEYKESKKDQMPNDIEAKIFETFYLLEIARWKVRYLELKYEQNKQKETLKELELQIYQVNDLELKLEILQQSNNSRKPIKKTGFNQKIKQQKKDEQIDKIITVEEVAKQDEKLIENMLKNKKILF
jgi:hypothetical protein